MYESSLVPCSASTREAVLERYPPAVECTVTRRFLAVVLLSTRVDRETGCPLVDRDRALSYVAGYPVYSSNGRDVSSAEALLERMRDSLLPGLTWSPACEGRARAITAPGVDPDVERLVRADLEGYGDGPLVDFATGAPVDRRALRQEARDEAVLAAGRAPSETSRYLARRMNDPEARPPHGFSKLVQFAYVAVAATLQASPTRRPGEADEEYAARVEVARTGYLRVIRAVSAQPQPFYGPSRRRRTDRIFAQGPSLLGLPGPVREAWVRRVGWVGADLASAHLAVAAAVWDARRTGGFLAAGGDVWAELVRELGVADGALSQSRRRRLKRALKTAVYSATYGMGEPHVRGAFTRAARPFGLDGRDLVRTWPVRELLGCREDAFRRVREGRYPPPPTGLRLDYAPDAGVHERHVLSAVASGYEALLMRPVLEYEAAPRAARAAGVQPDFRVMLWAHDGVEVWFRRKRPTHQAALEAAVDSAAATFDVPTRLAFT